MKSFFAMLNFRESGFALFKVEVRFYKYLFSQILKSKLF